jgi:hypothetical protein
VLQDSFHPPPRIEKIISAGLETIRLYAEIVELIVFNRGIRGVAIQNGSTAVMNLIPQLRLTSRRPHETRDSAIFGKR